jgi:preprotein translocase subunit SecF
MSGLSRLIHGRTSLDFVGRRKQWYMISGILIVVSIAALGIRHLNLGIEFEGGVSIEADNVNAVDLPTIRESVTGAGVENPVVQMLAGGSKVRVRTPVLSGSEQENLRQAIAAVTGTSVDNLSVRSVGPSFGALLARQAVIALVVFIGAVALFITWRLEFKMALAALAALFHDLIITAGVYAITGFEVTSATVVALLTILGYSLYDTVVVFDQVSEAVADASRDETYIGVVNHSMNHVLVRSINTSLTSLLPVGSLLFVGSLILGAASLRDFALALFVGIASGTYSSIFVAGPLLAEWKRDAPVGAEKRRAERQKKSTEGYTPRLTNDGGNRRPPRAGGGSSSANRPPRPPKGRR